ncbi:MAG: hypothetical protein GF334_04850 [Candidatus Altiarchaeales archaeon]|nr:hypothetical protein [Candidatus Altiarchaeales archaeon]
MVEVTHPLVNHVAKNTLEWRDENKFSFVWDNQVVLMHFDRERARYTLISDVQPRVEEAIYRWLGSVIQKPIEEQEDEQAL